MIQCSICSKHFANKRSLSSHKHRYHKNNSSTKEKTNTEIMNSFEKVNSENYDIIPNTDEDTGKEILSDSIDNNHSTDSNMGGGLRKVNHTMVDGKRIIRQEIKIH